MTVFSCSEATVRGGLARVKSSEPGGGGQTALADDAATSSLHQLI